jgi:hypothetical protein
MKKQKLAVQIPTESNSKDEARKLIKQKLREGTVLVKYSYDSINFKN